MKKLKAYPLNTITSLQGYLNLNYDEIVSIFGEPSSKFPSGDFKVDWEWILEIDNEIITIYNYKDGPSYERDISITSNDIKSWHIGGKNQKVLKILEKEILKLTGNTFANINIIQNWRDH